MGPWVGLGWRLVAWISNLWNILNHPCLLNLHASLLPTRGSGPTWRPGYSSSIFSMGFYIELLTNNKTSVTIIFSRSFTLYSRQPTIFSLNRSRLYSALIAADYIQPQYLQNFRSSIKFLPLWVTLYFYHEFVFLMKTLFKILIQNRLSNTIRGNTEMDQLTRRHKCQI